MGDPKYSRKKSARPRNPWQRNLLKEELELVGNFGLRNKKELHVASTELSRIRKQARQLLAATTEIRTTREPVLLSSLTRKGIVNEDATLDNVLALNVSNFLERRLQTVVLKKGLARTPHQARQLVTHGHIAIGENRITIPSYTVTRNEEQLIKMTENSTFVLQEIAVKEVKSDTYGNPDEKEELNGKVEEKPAEKAKAEEKPAEKAKAEEKPAEKAKAEDIKTKEESTEK
jgi:small subunit ribosomal protein S4